MGRIGAMFSRLFPFSSLSGVQSEEVQTFPGKAERVVVVDEFRQSEEEGPLEKAMNDQGRRGPSKIFRSGAGASGTRRVIRIDCQAMVGGVTAAQETQSSSR